MTNKEKYKRTFDTLASSERFSLEVTEMKKENKTKHIYNRIAAAAAAFVLVISASTAAYASDLGGIRTMVSVWINGEHQDAVVTSKDGDNYTFTYKDDAGKNVTIGGSGVTLDENGNKRPMTASEIAEGFGTTEINREDNGKIYLTYKNLKFDITSAMDAGKTKFTFTADGETHYVTVNDTENEGIGSYDLTDDCVGPDGNASSDASDYEALN